MTLLVSAFAGFFSASRLVGGRCPECVGVAERAEARLVGGCLSVLVTTLGLPTRIDTDGAILFLEDVAREAVPDRPQCLPTLSTLESSRRVRGRGGLGSMLDCDGGEGEACFGRRYRSHRGQARAGSCGVSMPAMETGNVVLPFGMSGPVTQGRSN